MRPRRHLDPHRPRRNAPATPSQQAPPARKQNASCGHSARTGPSTTSMPSSDTCAGRRALRRRDQDIRTRHEIGRTTRQLRLLALGRRHLGGPSQGNRPAAPWRYRSRPTGSSRRAAATGAALSAWPTHPTSRSWPWTRSLATRQTRGPHRSQRSARRRQRSHAIGTNPKIMRLYRGAARQGLAGWRLLPSRRSARSQAAPGRRFVGRTRCAASPGGRRGRHTRGEGRLRRPGPSRRPPICCRR